MRQNVGAQPDQVAPAFIAGRFYSRKDVRAALGLSDRGLDTLLARWAVPALRLGRKVIRFRGEDLLAVLERAAG